MTRVVLDTSAVIAGLDNEPGADVVRASVKGSLMSAVNFAELITKLIELGLPQDQALSTAERAGFEVVPVDQQRAALAGLLHAKTRRTGVSLGDRFCLALAQETGLPVLTTDRRWKELGLDIEITLIR